MGSSKIPRDDHRNMLNYVKLWKKWKLWQRLSKQMGDCTALRVNYLRVKRIETYWNILKPKFLERFTGWWFGTWLLLWDVILPIDELIFFRGVETTSQIQNMWKTRGFLRKTRYKLEKIVDFCTSMLVYPGWKCMDITMKNGSLTYLPGKQNCYENGSFTSIIYLFNIVMFPWMWGLGNLVKKSWNLVIWCNWIGLGYFSNEHCKLLENSGFVFKKKVSSFSGKKTYAGVCGCLKFSVNLGWVETNPSVFWYQWDYLLTNYFFCRVS